MDLQALQILQNIQARLEEQELKQQQEKAEQERLRQQEKAEQEENQRILLETFVEHERKLNEKLDKQQESFQKEIAEVKEQLTRIENHVLIIRGKVVPVDLDGITPETKEELQELCTEAYDLYLDSPNEFDPRLQTQYDPRDGVEKPITSDKSLNSIKNKQLFRVKHILSEPNFTHSHKIIFGDFTSKFSKVLWGYDFDGWYPEKSRQVFKTLKHYFFKERSKSTLVKNGRWT